MEPVDLFEVGFVNTTIKQYPNAPAITSLNALIPTVGMSGYADLKPPGSFYVYEEANHSGALFDPTTARFYVKYHIPEDYTIGEYFIFVYYPKTRQRKPSAILIPEADTAGKGTMKWQTGMPLVYFRNLVSRKLFLDVLPQIVLSVNSLIEAAVQNRQAYSSLTIYSLFWESGTSGKIWLNSRVGLDQWTDNTFRAFQKSLTNADDARVYMWYHVLQSFNMWGGKPHEDVYDVMVKTIMTLPVARVLFS